MTTTREVQSSTLGPILYVALELGERGWKLALTTGLGQAPRLRTVRTRALDEVHCEIDKAKKRFRLPADAKVVTCYEAGRDGFWIHRGLTTLGIVNHVLDSSSIEVNRKQRRAKSDRLDATKLVRLLIRYEMGDKCCRVVQAPSKEAEDQRELHRELTKLKAEQTSLVNQLKGHVVRYGIELRRVNEHFPTWLAKARCADGQPVPAELRERLLRMFERWKLIHQQILDVERDQRKRICNDATPGVAKIRLLMSLRGIGWSGAWMLVKELFAWRVGFNRKQLGSLVGLTPTPHASGTSEREQGISKAGNKRLRQLLVELAWCWVRFQPQSALTKWFHARFGKGKRLRRIGITAVARKLLIALWRFVETGELPDGADLVYWEEKVMTKMQAEKRRAAEEAAAAAVA